MNIRIAALNSGAVLGTGFLWLLGLMVLSYILVAVYDLMLFAAPSASDLVEILKKQPNVVSLSDPPPMVQVLGGRMWFLKYGEKYAGQIDAYMSDKLVRAVNAQLCGSVSGRNREVAIDSLRKAAAVYVLDQIAADELAASEEAKAKRRQAVEDLDVAVEGLQHFVNRNTTDFSVGSDGEALANPNSLR